jgi:hypothetical protein
MIGTIRGGRVSRNDHQGNHKCDAGDEASNKNHGLIHFEASGLSSSIAGSGAATKARRARGEGGLAHVQHVILPG